MARVIISLVGTSLLTNHIESLLDANKINAFASEFLNGYQRTMHRKPRDIVEIIKSDKEEELASCLKNTISSGNETQASAETNSLSKISLQSKDILYFLSSNTLSGQICAKSLYQYYNGKNCFVVKGPIIIQKLEKDTFEGGLRELTDRIVEIIDKQKRQGNEIIINATAGYKPESAYATLSAILGGVKTNYIHEEFDSAVELPPIPINFNLSIFHKNATWVRLASKGNERVYQKLPKGLKDLIIFNQQRDSPFTPLGRVLWNAYLTAISPRGRITPDIGLINKLHPEHQAKVFKFIEKWDSLWVGSQVPQMVDHEQSHCQDILNLTEQALLPILEENANFLIKEEIYYFISAIFLHDIGYAETTDDAGNILFSEDIRKRHSELTYQTIKNDPKDFGFKEFNNEARLIAKICKYHQRRYKLTELPEKENAIRVRFLTTLLRIFDACDCQKSRAGEEDYREMRLHANEREKNLYQKILEQKNPKGWIKEYIESKIEFIEKQEEHFRIHSKISLVHIEPERLTDRWKCKIVYHPTEKRGAIEDFENYIYGELNAPCVQKTLADNSLEFKIENGECLPLET